MGTDVHVIFEKKVSKGNGTVQSEWEPITSKYEENRHYRLFSWLADVRNGYGFAGAPTNTRIEPIVEPRGIPTEYEDDSTFWKGDHSRSWLLGSEIIAAIDHIHGIGAEGVIPIEAYHAWDKVSAPDGYIGAVGGLHIVIVNQSEVETPGAIENIVAKRKAEIELSVHPTPTFEPKLYVKVHWQVTADDLREEFAYFTDEIKRLVKEHGEVRMIFGFDS